MAQSPEKTGSATKGGKNGDSTAGLRPAKGEIPHGHADFIKPRSPAEKKVAEMKSALQQIGQEPPKLTARDIDRLMPYYEGTLEIPPKNTPNGSGIRDEIALHQAQLRDVHEKRGRAWMKDPKNAGEIRRLEALKPEGRKIKPLGVPFTHPGSGADDLPSIPPILQLAFEEDQNLAHRARNAFTLALRGVGFKDTPEGKLCEIFIRMFDERNKAHIDAHDIANRNQFDNAALALLTYKIIYPVVQKQKMGDGSEKDRVGFGINLNLLERHAEVFLIKEQWHRLEKAIARTKDGGEKERLTQAQEALKTKKEDADMFLKNVGAALDVKNPRTIFESFGNRLYVRAADLPVFDTPQPGDTEKGRGVSSRSLDAALNILNARQTIDEKRFRSDDLVVRASEFSNVLQYAAEELHEFGNSVAIFKEGIPDEDTLMVARRVLKQLIDKLDRTEVRSVRRVRDRSRDTLSKSDKNEDSMKMRVSLFTPLEKRAEELLRSYETLLEALGKIIFTREVEKTPDADKKVPEAPTTVKSPEISARLQKLELQFKEAIKEVTQNRELIRLIQTVITNPSNSREEISAIIAQFLEDESASDK